MIITLLNGFCSPWCQAFNGSNGRKSNVSKEKIWVDDFANNKQALKENLCVDQRALLLISNKFHYFLFEREIALYLLIWNQLLTFLRLSDTLCSLFYRISLEIKLELCTKKVSTNQVNFRSDWRLTTTDGCYIKLSSLCQDLKCKDLFWVRLWVFMKWNSWSQHANESGAIKYRNVVVAIQVNCTQYQYKSFDQQGPPDVWIENWNGNRTVQEKTCIILSGQGFKVNFILKNRNATDVEMLWDSRKRKKVGNKRTLFQCCQL